MDYLKILEEHFPSDEVSCSDRGDYSTITFHTSPIRTKTELDSLWLPICKKIAKDKVDARTGELVVTSGITFNSELFSSSVNAQSNWTNIDHARLEITYPFKVSTKGGGSYSFIDALEVHNFYMSGLNQLYVFYYSGQTIREQIEACTTVAEVEAVIDNR